LSSHRGVVKFKLGHRPGVPFVKMRPVNFAAPCAPTQAEFSAPRKVVVISPVLVANVVACRTNSDGGPDGDNLLCIKQLEFMGLSRATKFRSK